jgi:NAD(P)H dehydrogenase (quinone)
MKTTLIVSAHPGRAGFTHQMVSRLKGIKKQARRVVEVVNLYDEDPLSFLKFEGKDDITLDECLQIYQDQIRRADEIFFIFPCWWGDCPSIMRNWFDHVFSKGFAFTYGKRRPEGLLEGKDCYVIMTTGTPALIYRITGVTRAMRRIWSTTRIRFCGMRLKAFLVIGSMDTKNRDEAGALAKIDRLASS